MSQSSPSPDGQHFVVDLIAADQSQTLKWNERVAVRHLRKLLRRKPLVADLTTQNIEFVAIRLLELGRRPGTVNRYCQVLAKLGKHAAARGLIDAAPRYIKRAVDGQRVPFTIAELERIIAAALETTAAESNGAAAGAWWPALILLSLDTRRSGQSLLNLPEDAFSVRYSTLYVDGVVFPLHASTVEALGRLGDRTGKSRLFPWPATGKQPTFRLCIAFRRILKRAGVPDQHGSAFDRLRISVHLVGSGVLDRLSPERIERERRAARERRLTDEARVRTPKTPKRRRPGPRPDVYAIENRTPRALRIFFLEVYVPARLATRSSRTVDQYTNTINKLRDFAACDVTLDQLNSDFVDRFIAWYLAAGGAAVCANKHLATIKTIWRFAMKKKRLAFSFEPELVEKCKTVRKLPSAWTLAEFEAILKRAAQLDGDFHGLEVRLLLPALMLTAFYTGARIGALVQLRTSALNLESGWLTIAGDIAKHAREQRYRLPEACLQAIRATDPTSRLMLFGGSLPPHRRVVDSRASHLREFLLLAVAAAGLAGGVKDGWHKIRRLAATQIARVAGASAATELLGHSSPRLVFDHYLDRSQLANNPADLLPKIDWTPPPAA